MTETSQLNLLREQTRYQKGTDHSTFSFSSSFTGKTGEGSKPERKPLGDLSNIRKPRFSNRVTKDLSTEPKAQENAASVKRNYTLTKDQIKQCEEWAQEGIEKMQFTGNDIQQLERDHIDKRNS